MSKDENLNSTWKLYVIILKWWIFAPLLLLCLFRKFLLFHDLNIKMHVWFYLLSSNVGGRKSDVYPASYNCSWSRTHPTFRCNEKKPLIIEKLSPFRCRIEINKFVQKIGSSDSSSFWRSFQPDCLRKGLSVLDPKTGQEETEFRFKLVITSARAFYVQMTTIELELICGTDASKILGLLTWFECIHHARSLLTSHQILKCFIEWGFNYINCPQHMPHKGTERRGNAIRWRENRG